jgi:hypothetical protein
MTKRAAFGRASLAVALVSLLSGCSDTTISLRHDPPYRAEPHTSTISVTARSESGIQRIVVDLLVGDLVACTDPNLPSMFPCRRNGFWVTYTCNFELPPISGEGDPDLPAEVGLGPVEATCPVSRTLNALKLLTYRASVLDGSGRTTSTNYITYSGGAPPVAYPTVAPSFADVLRPVWLESEETPIGGDPAQIYWDMTRRLDVAFLPEVDWGADYRGFADAAGDVASRLLFEPLYGNAVPEVMADYVLHKRLFSYWVGPTGADIDGDICELTSSGWVDAARAVTDGQAIVHKTNFRISDCSEGFGWGTVQASLNTYADYAHESGHFLFCMGDEYQGAQATQVACAEPANTFRTPEECEETAVAYGFPTEQCLQIRDSNMWHITDGSLDIMAKTIPTSSGDWRDTNHILFQRQMAACLAGACR